MILVVGLGNIGKEYEKTRHNAGFLTADFLRDKLCFGKFQNNPKFKAEITEGDFKGEKLLLTKPQTYMNKSGEAVQKIASYYKIPLANVWTIYDDIDLPLGEVRIRKRGSAGTHNGMSSVISHLGSENFPRFRLGVGEGSIGFGKHDLKDWILSPIPKKERPIFEKMVKKAGEAVIFSLTEGLEAAMNRYNS